MTLLEFYGMVNNDSEEHYILYIGVGIKCRDGEVFFEPTDPRHWTYRFINYFGNDTIQAITSTPKTGGYQRTITIWINTPFRCEYVSNTYRPAAYMSSLVTLNDGNITES